MAKKFDAVLFDMDGTVLDTADDLADAVNYVLRTHNMPERTRRQVMNATGNGAAELIGASVPQERAAEIAAVLRDFRIYYDAHARIKTAPYPGIIELIDALASADVKVAIVSNKPHSAVVELAETFFPGVFSVGEQAGIPRKPAPDMLFHTLAQLGVEKERAVYVGDSEVDVATVRAAGMPLAAVSYGFRSREVLENLGAEVICDTVEELAKFLLDT